MKHIKTPIRRAKPGTGWTHAYVYDADNEYLASVSIETHGETAIEKADEFVLAVNAHDALVAALKAQEDIAAHGRQCDNCSPGFPCFEGSRLFLDATRMRRAALALAGGDDVA